MAKSPGKGPKRTQGVVGYLRVSTEEQAISGLGLSAKEKAIRVECRHRGLPLVALHTDAGVSAKTLARPALTAGLGDLDAGRGSVLIVSKLDRLSRNVHDASGLLQRAAQSGWDLVALDAPVDTTTPQGAAMAQVLAVFAELERKLIGERTKAALAVKRSQGVRLGRPPSLPTDVVERIVTERKTGATWSAIARRLNEAGVATAQGGRQWHPATVRYVALSSANRPYGAENRGRKTRLRTAPASPVAEDPSR
ncbi:MAG: recombinase family protein [Candidatus Dormibacteraceae bacterium]